MEPIRLTYEQLAELKRGTVIYRAWVHEDSPHYEISDYKLIFKWLSVITTDKDGIESWSATVKISNYGYTTLIHSKTHPNFNFHTNKDFLEAQLRLNGYIRKIHKSLVREDDDGTDTINV